MLKRVHLYAIIIASAILLALVSGFLILNQSSNNKITLQSLEPNLLSSNTKVTNILVFDARGYVNGTDVTIRNLQAIVNTNHPNGTMLFIISSSQDLLILQNIYETIPDLSITRFRQFNNLNENLADLLTYFKGLIKGFIYFNSTDKIFFPAVLNYVANYPNTIAIPYPDYSLLPKDFNFLEMYNFVNKTDSSSISKISEYYSNQINTLRKNLQGTNLWNYQTDNNSYFDFVIGQRYFSFPTVLFNGSFPTLEQKIISLTNSFFNKPVLNSWPSNLPRLSEPLFNDIQGINNLSFYVYPLSFKLPLTSTFQQLFPKNYQIPVSNNSSTVGRGFNYSLVINAENETIPFLFSTVTSLLVIDPTFFDNTTIVVDDAIILLFPEIFYWIFANHPHIHFIPRIEIGTIIESVYFPQYFNDSIGFIQNSSLQLLRNDWTSQDYNNLIQKHFKGFISTDKNALTNIFSTQVKQPSASYSMLDNISENTLIAQLQLVTANRTAGNIVFTASGLNSFLIQFVINSKLAIKFMNTTMNTSFNALPPNLVYAGL